MTDWLPGEGRHARVEREQRWLAIGVPVGAVRTATIIDRYITGTRFRLRRTEGDRGVTLKFTQKVREQFGDPEIVKLTNVYLAADEYAVLAGLPACEVRKSRWHVLVGERTVAIDEFHDRLDGLVLAEVELDESDDRLPLPVFALEDVTNNDLFSGGALAFASDAAVHELLLVVAGRR